MPRFEWKVVEGLLEQRCLLLCVPSFALTGSIVVVNPVTLEPSLVSFGIVTGKEGAEEDGKSSSDMAKEKEEENVPGDGNTILDFDFRTGKLFARKEGESQASLTNVSLPGTKLGMDVVEEEEQEVVIEDLDEDDEEGGGEGD
jgi:hypothetical protein